MRIEITRIGRPPLSFAKSIQIQFIKAKEANIAIGNATRDRMREIIKENTKRPGSTGTLQKSIEAHVENGGSIVGVGKISQLPVYWAAQNYGSAHIVGLTLPGGSFQPGNPVPDAGSFRQGRWVVGAAPLSTPTVRRPIPPMNYVEKTISWTATIWRVHFQKSVFGREVNKVRVDTII